MLTQQIHQKMWYLSLLVFKDIAFKYEPYLCDGYHCLMQNAINFKDFAIVSIKGSDYRIHLWYMSKDDAMNIRQTSNSNDKRGFL